ncbi:MAG: 3-hydroxybutyrate dehydrogenase [Alphaproteobacteria bacterium]|nr:3-hydroxybutyrate dehydrogenase [Alphaproteobacteria bacterium]
MTTRKTALVTGSTSGIGLAVATAMAQAGMNVVLNGFGDPAAIESVRADLESNYGVTVLYHGADMSKPDEVRALCQKALDTFGAVDVLVNNAGIQHVSPIESFPEEKWDAILAVSLSSAFHTCKALVPGMREKGWGRIVNIGSIHSLVASANKAAYVATKFGLLGLTKVVALETAKDNITCNCVCPAYVDTPLVRNQIPGQAKTHGIPEEDVIEKIMLAPQPVKKLVAPADLAAFVLFLCSDAGQNITGAALPVDGGWTAQ